MNRHHYARYSQIASVRQNETRDFQADSQADPRWYVVLAQPRQEDRALLNLERQGFRGFIPKREETKIVRSRFVTRLRPVFPRYLLVLLSLGGQSWFPINSTFGVSRIVCFGMRPAPLPRGIAESLHESLNEKGVLQFEEPLKQGDKVRLVRGAFAQQLGVLQSLDEKGRVKLLIDMLGGKILINANAEDLEKTN
jgi:transcription elongation factor/antiterminator RfaH